MFVRKGTRDVTCFAICDCPSPRIKLTRVGHFDIFVCSRCCIQMPEGLSGAGILSSWTFLSVMWISTHNVAVIVVWSFSCSPSGTDSFCGTLVGIDFPNGQIGIPIENGEQTSLGWRKACKIMHVQNNAGRL